MPVGNWIDQRIKVESWQIRILSFDEYNIRSVVPKMKQELAKILLSWPKLNASLLFAQLWFQRSHQVRWTWCGRLLYK